MTIYLDIIFIINFAADMALNFTCAVLADRKIRLLKVLVISLFGALYGTISVIFPVMKNAFAALLYSCINIFLLFGKSAKEDFIRHMLIYCFVCIIAGGACTVFSGSSPNAVEYSGKLFLPADDTGIFISLVFVCSISKLIKLIMKYKKLKYEIVLKVNDKEVHCNSYYDTGNTLTEPISGEPVIVISRKTADALECKSFGGVKYNTVSDSDKTIDLIKVDELIFCKEKKALSNVYCGISDFQNESFDVLLNKHTHP